MYHELSPLAAFGRSLLDCCPRGVQTANNEGAANGKQTRHPAHFCKERNHEGSVVKIARSFSPIKSLADAPEAIILTDGISPCTPKRPPLHRKSTLILWILCHVAEKYQPFCSGAKSTKTCFSRHGRIVHGNAALHGVYRVLSGLVWDGVSEMDEEMHNFCHQTGYHIWLFLGRFFMYIGSILLLPRHPF